MRSLFWIFLAMVVVGCGRTPQGDISDNGSAISQDSSVCALGNQSAQCNGSAPISTGNGPSPDSNTSNNDSNNYNNGPVTVGSNPSVPTQSGSPSTGSPSSSTQTSPAGQGSSNPAPPVVVQPPVEPTISYQTVNCESVGTTTTVPYLIFWTKTITNYSEVQCALDPTTFRVEKLTLSAECELDKSLVITNNNFLVSKGCKATIKIAKLAANHSEVLITKQKELICSAAKDAASICQVNGPITYPRLNQILSGNCNDDDYGVVMNLLWVNKKCSASFDVEYQGIHGE